MTTNSSECQRSPGAWRTPTTALSGSSRRTTRLPGRRRQPDLPEGGCGVDITQVVRTNTEMANSAPGVSPQIGAAAAPVFQPNSANGRVFPNR